MSHILMPSSFLRTKRRPGPHVEGGRPSNGILGKQAGVGRVLACARVPRPLNRAAGGPVWWDLGLDPAACCPLTGAPHHPHPWGSAGFPPRKAMGSQARSSGPISSRGLWRSRVPHLTAASSQGKPLFPDKVGAVRATHPSPVLTPMQDQPGDSTTMLSVHMGERLC